MAKTNIPPLIPPPLPPQQRPASQVGENLVGAELRSQDDQTRYLFGSILVGLLLLIFLFILFFASNGGAGGGDGDKLGSGSANGEVEGVLDGDSLRGDSLENGQDEKTLVQAGEPAPEQQSVPGTETPTDEITSPGRGEEATATNQQGGDGDSATSAEQQTALLSMVPNRQNASRNASTGNLPPGAAGDLGTDLSSSKGMNPFVGEGKPAASTVFVIDVSGSMQSFDKLPRVMNALGRAIDQLKDNQKLCVLLFDTGYYFEPSLPGLVPANKKNRERIKAWLQQPPGGGGTEPMAALAAAIDLKPERIVLLSDGEFDPTNVQTITALNAKLKKPARIDCVGLMEEVYVLKEIAKANKGTYYQAW
jgi:Mg-chelatase subunit ChlD